jgi:uncharacterized protein YqiB (DUF1249 family)
VTVVVVIRDSYKVDLSALHACCEANYARLLRLFPDYEQSNERRFAVGDEHLHFEVLERSRYTTLLRLSKWCRGTGTERRWLSPLRVDLRAYHDAAMLEVIAFQGIGRFAARYAYPNPRMHQQDEKSRQNAFLADWLEHCLQHGEARIERLSGPNAD